MGAKEAEMSHLISNIIGRELTSRERSDLNAFMVGKTVDDCCSALAQEFVANYVEDDN